MTPTTWTLHDAAERLRRRELSAVELARAYLDRIAALDGQLGAYLTVTPERALDQAAAADRALAAGDASPLCGVPYAAKDILCTAGVRTTCASRILGNFVPPYDATAIARLHTAGAVLLGKTNLDEFGMGSSNENSAFFPVRNPWDLARVPGGSSGGSGAAVAADLCTYALGSDTGGSVRLPASFCGIVGLKPTYGRVSRYGLIAYASSLDVIGVLAKCVADAALALGTIAGGDPCDSTSGEEPVPDYRAALDGDITRLRVGVIREFLGPGLDPAVRAPIEAAIAQLRALGVPADEATLPSTEYALAAYYLIAPAEASANLARYDGVKYGLRVGDADVWGTLERTRAEGFGAEVKRRIMLGTYALSAGYYEAYYVKAQQVRTLIKQDFDRAFERFDVLVGPTAPVAAFRFGERMDDPLTMYLADAYTIPVNIAGLPAIVVPCGFAGHLPVGLQLIGRPFDEPTLLRLAHAYEQATPWHTRKPPVAGGATHDRQ